MNFNFLFNTRSWQSVLAANVDAAFKRSAEDASGERRINLIDCEAALEHMLLSIGARRSDQPRGSKHLITGASARLSVRAVPDIHVNAGVSNFWRKRASAPGLNLTRPSAADAARGPSETL